MMRVWDDAEDDAYVVFYGDWSVYRFHGVKAAGGVDSLGWVVAACEYDAWVCLRVLTGWRVDLEDLCDEAG